MATWKISAVLTGGIGDFAPGGRRSAIHKSPAEGPLAVSAAGVANDEHGDPVNHGGPDRAVHHYSFDNYAFWRSAYPDQAERFTTPGFFGENLTSRGFAEPDVCVGDLYRIGRSLLQVSQARQPCWKLAFRSGIPDFALRVQQEGRTGWFYRVLEAGEIAAGEEMTLLERPHPDWNLKRLLEAMYVRPLDRRELEGMVSLAELTESWREIAAHRLESGRVESWDSRVTLPFD